MVCLSYPWLLANLVASASATGAILPLYIYPSAEYNDGAANWAPAFDAIDAHSNVPWLVVVNVDSGPGGSYQPGDADINYIAGATKLNAYSNVQTVGYVHTRYAATPMDELQANITAWASWGSYADADISVQGIFFDESSADYAYLEEATNFARQAFGTDITTVCNFGVAAGQEYYDICDVVVAFESCLNCDGLPQYKSQTTLDANIPSGYESQVAVIVNSFTGTAYDGSAADASLLQEYVDTAAADGVSWVYFCSAGYDSITSTPVTVGQLADALA
ncbi:Spherulation-specific family 4-domain-containing protein [Xylariomycetidae sp. FL2044]|nr:Spherulation-specific family 4-domain-containing protein [Xylariomycetidae sp. FL2044]